MLTRLVVCAVRLGVVVVDTAAGAVIAGFGDVVAVGALVAVAVLAVVVASTGGVCLAGTMVVLVDAGATVGFEVTVVVVLDELLTVPAHKPLELDCSFSVFHQSMDLSQPESRYGADFQDQYGHHDAPG